MIEELLGGGGPRYSSMAWPVRADAATDTIITMPPTAMILA
jgi:hypothetical protein